mgnify:CR=1 FL=1
MATCSGICGITINCGSHGCGIFCTTDCSDCTSWCEPTTLPAFDDTANGLVVNVARESGEPTVDITFAGIRVQRQYDGLEEFRLVINDVSLVTLAKVLGSVSPVPVQPPAGINSADRVSGTGTGTVDALAKKFGLVVG